MMHKAMWDRIHCGTPYQVDGLDKAILAARIEEWDKHEGPRVGDFVNTSKGLLRLTHDWGEDIQTTVPGTHPCAGDVSFYFSKGGYMSFSGSLDHGIPKARLQLTPEVREGSCWFFSHDYVEAHNGVHVKVPCRVYQFES